MSMQSLFELWAANPHQYGPGKVHIVDPKDKSKTLCGRFLAAVPGSYNPEGKPTCRICLDATVRRPEQERQQQEWERRRAEQERQKAAERRQWQSWYANYLSSPEWRTRRALVMERADGLCEGCRLVKASEVHHVSYEHAGNEFLWELRAMCRGCHERWHAKDGD